MAGRIDDLYVGALPVAGGHRGGDGDAALLLVHHPVHDGLAIMHLTDLIRLAGIEKDPFGNGGLAGIDVGDNADVPDVVDFGGSLHRLYRDCRLSADQAAGFRPTG